MTAAAAGDESAWRRLVERYAGRIYGLLVRQCGDRELAEEIAQATFVKIVDKLGQYADCGRFEAWLFRIAMNRLRDEMRRRKRHAVNVDFAETPPETIGYHANGTAVGGFTSGGGAMEAAEDAAALHRAIAQLPAADQELIHLRYTADLSFQQIAEMLQAPLGTVLARGHRAIKKLRTLMQPAPEEGTKGLRD
ncbi:MAG: RNA polymerase sigma factor [Phycisphaerales bacterium]